MAALFSKKLFVAINPGPLGQLSAPVPAGFVWDVRDVVAINRSLAPWEGAGGFACVGNISTVQLFACGTETVGSRSYHAELRQILDEGDQIVAFGFLPGWVISFAGYQLTKP